MKIIIKKVATISTAATLIIFKTILLLVFLYPLLCIHKRFNPWGYLIVLAVGRIPGVLPGEESTLQVRHHTEMTTVGRADTCHVVVGSVRIGGITGVIVLGNHVVAALWLRQMELTLTVSHPKT